MERRCSGQHCCLTAPGSWFQIHHRSGASACGAPPVPAWLPSGHSSFLTQSKDMHVRIAGDSELVIGVSVCLPLCYPRDSKVMAPVQAVPCLPEIGSSQEIQKIQNLCGWINRYSCQNFHAITEVNNFFFILACRVIFLF